MVNSRIKRAATEAATAIGVGFYVYHWGPDFMGWLAEKMTRRDAKTAEQLGSTALHEEVEIIPAPEEPVFIPEQQ